MKSKDWFSQLMLGLVAVGLAYVALYGVVRWRKLLVMKEVLLKEQAVQLRYIGPGEDCRFSWRGEVKNWLAPALPGVFYPLVSLENSVRGGKRPLP